MQTPHATPLPSGPSRNVSWWPNCVAYALKTPFLSPEGAQAAVWGPQAPVQARS